MPSFSQDVYSDMAQGMSYDADSQQLTIVYNTGKAYTYFDVPEDTARSVANAASVGQAINAEIKGKFRFSRG